MPPRRSIFALLFILAAAAPATAAEKAASLPSDADVRTSVARSLPFVEKAGLTWMHDKGCISCHTVSFMLWSHNVARSRGITIDEAKLAEWTAWSADQSLSHRDDNPVKSGGKNDGAGMETMAQLLVGRDAAGKAGKWPELVASTPALISQMQQKDGHWKAGGQLPRLLRPAAEGDAISTRWAILAMASVEKPDPAVTAAIERGLAAINDAPPGKCLEDLVTRLLVARQFGQPEAAAELRKQLTQQQHADGGWSTLADGPSDALATGQALYALSQPAGSPPEDAIARARCFLLDTQQEDGTWPVTGQGISNAATPERKKKVEPIYKYWGTAWAAIGLGMSLPEKKSEHAGV